LVLGLVGVVVLNAGGDFFGRGISTLALLVAPIAWALGSVWGKRLPLAPGLMGTATPMLMAGVELFAVGLLAGERLPHAPTVHSMEALAYLVVFGSLVGFSAYMFLLRNTRPATATSYAYVNPLVAIIIGAAFGGERIGTATIVGAMVILAAVVVLTVTRSAGRPASKPEPGTAATCPTAQEP
jgi:drug/metabolite transporter (DMT)-like permease